MTEFQQTFTSPAYPYGSYTLLSSEPGTYRLWCQIAPFGLQEVLIDVPPTVAGWTQHDRHQDDTIAGV
jgi:hypothetical protein